jgi:hypothetical protein
MENRGHILESLTKLVMSFAVTDSNGVQSLPLPQNSKLSKANVKSLVKAARILYDSWVWTLDQDGLFFDVPETPDLERESGWFRLNDITGSYYAYAVQRLIELQIARESEPVLLPGINPTEMDRWMEAGKKERGDRDFRNRFERLRQELESIGIENMPPEDAARVQSEIRELLSESTVYENIDASWSELQAYSRWLDVRSSARLIASASLLSLFFCYVGTVLNKQATKVTPSAAIEIAESASVQILPYQHELALRLSYPELRQSALKHLGIAIACLNMFREKKQALQGSKETLNAFSAIRLSELQPMASRDGKLAERYGAKNLEKEFEQQLSLVWQSLGFYVVPTRPGQPTVDLICIAPDTSMQAVFLVEAKTSRNPYTLPRDDARALLEYIDAVKRGLTTFPALSFVLIVGPAASANLELKLHQLGAEAGLPIRFASAEAIVRLREAIVGPIHADDLIKYIIQSPVIVPLDWADDMRKRYQERSRVHEDFVQTMLKLLNYDFPSLEDKVR